MPLLNSPAGYGALTKPIHWLMLTLSVEDQLHAVLLLLTTHTVNPDCLYQPVKDRRADTQPRLLQFLPHPLPVTRVAAANAQKIDYKDKDGVMTLYGVPAQTMFFTDRPTALLTLIAATAQAQ
jgi:energy-converting hydrogenase Eha subunit F